MIDYLIPLVFELLFHYPGYYIAKLFFKKASVSLVFALSLLFWLVIGIIIYLLIALTT